jgi:hypothetical protein
MKYAKCGASNPPAGKSAKVKMMGGGMAMKKKPAYGYGGMAHKMPKKKK